MGLSINIGSTCRLGLENLGTVLSWILKQNIRNLPLYDSAKEVFVRYIVAPKDFIIRDRVSVMAGLSLKTKSNLVQDMSRHPVVQFGDRNDTIELQMVKT